MAAAQSQSIDQKFPCPSTKGYLIDQPCARRTIASYIEASPCGWYFHITSQTILADFLCF